MKKKNKKHPLSRSLKFGFWGSIVLFLINSYRHFAPFEGSLIFHAIMDRNFEEFAFLLFSFLNGFIGGIATQSLLRIFWQLLVPMILLSGICFILLGRKKERSPLQIRIPKVSLPSRAMKDTTDPESQPLAEEATKGGLSPQAPAEEIIEAVPAPPSPAPSLQPQQTPAFSKGAEPVLKKELSVPAILQAKLVLNGEYFLSFGLIDSEERIQLRVPSMVFQVVQEGEYRRLHYQDLEQDGLLVREYVFKDYPAPVPPIKKEEPGITQKPLKDQQNLPAQHHEANPLITELRLYKKLLDEELITEADYNEKKNSLLKSSNP